MFIIKTIKNIWGIINFPILYLVSQVLFTFLFGIVSSFFVITTTMAKGEIIEPAIIAEQITNNIDLGLILLISNLFTLILILLLMKKYGPLKKVLNINKLSGFLVVLCVFVGIVFNLFTASAMNFFEVTKFFPEYEALMEVLFENTNPFFIIIAVTLVGPVLEEIIFRGIMMPRLSKFFNVPVTIFIQGFLFGLIHFNIVQSTYAFILGIALGIIFAKTKSLLSVIIVHIVFNSANILTGYLYLALGDGKIISLVLLIISSILSILGMIFISKESKKNVNLENLENF